MNWRLTRDATGQPEIQVRYDTDLTWGFSLLAELAREDRTMHRVTEGVYEVKKQPPGGFL